MINLHTDSNNNLFTRGVWLDYGVRSFLMFQRHAESFLNVFLHM